MRRREFLAALPPLAVSSVAMGATPDSRLLRPDVRAGDRVVGASFATRSLVYGANGAAACAHPLATLAGIETLKLGGSAVDAAITINACLGFLEPTACGIGGDLYAMLWAPGESRVMGLASSGRSPATLDLETVRAHARNGVLPSRGAVTVTVPGAVAGWWAMHQRYGRLPWAKVLEPAIAMCNDGAPMAPMIAYYLRRNVDIFRQPGAGVEESDNAVKTWAPNGQTPAEGEIFRNPDLARTYRLIAEGGRDAYYDGPIADGIEAYFRRIGGWLTRRDLAAHHAEWTTPLATRYRGVDVHAIGANTQGIATLQMLNLLEQFDMAGSGFLSTRSLHLQAEAKRLAYADRARYYADPDFSKVPVDWLISREYAAERARLIHPQRINEAVPPGQAPSQGDTTYLTVADAQGMMVSLIQSNFRGMGSGLVADGLGFMFHDRGQLFVLDDGHPNQYQPAKRPFQTIIPGFATRGGAPWLSFGVMGGDMQPQGQVQVLHALLDHGLDTQAAGDAPRWHHEGSAERMGEDSPGMGPQGLLRLESGIPEATRKGLVKLGWAIGEPDGGFGRYHCVERRTIGGSPVYAATSDMRADGLPLAY
jgi:gamma-glutamyltranspeptidase / glutathione hydrolase